MIKSEIDKRILTSLVLIPVVIISIFSERIYFNSLLFIVFLISTYEWYSINKKSLDYFSIGFLVIAAAFISAYFLKGNDTQSNFFFLWLLAVVIFSDTGGYIFGKTLGGKKLTKISPNKTISGMIGSFIFSTFPIIIIFLIKVSELVEFEYLSLSVKTFVLSLIFSLVSQAGDILVSYFKRKNNIKHSGKILPGHGGFLDRIDGLIFLLLFSAILKLLNVI